MHDDLIQLGELIHDTLVLGFMVVFGVCLYIWWELNEIKKKL